MAKMSMFLSKTRIFAMGVIVLMALYGCAGSKQASSPENVDGSVSQRPTVQAKFLLTLVDGNDKAQELDAVLFSEPGQQYRLELTGPLGIGVASLLWQPAGWQIVFPTEKQFLAGAGYMVGFLDDPSIPMVNIHQIANFFDGILLPEGHEIFAEKDSSGVHVVQAKEKSGRHFSYGMENGKVRWISALGRDGNLEILRFSEEKKFGDVEMPSQIVFERNEKMFLSIRIKKITWGKVFSSGTWRLNVPRSYKPVGQ